jgi:hypothetical protein
LKVWNLSLPSCHRFCLRRRSWVYKHRNSRTGAVFCVWGTSMEVPAAKDEEAMIRRSSWGDSWSRSVMGRSRHRCDGQAIVTDFQTRTRLRDFSPAGGNTVSRASTWQRIRAGPTAGCLLIQQHRDAPLQECAYSVLSPKYCCHPTPAVQSFMSQAFS